MNENKMSDGELKKLVRLLEKYQESDLLINDGVAMQDIQNLLEKINLK
jgi:hypothetical protein